MQKSIDKIYYAAIYLRLSKEDGDLSSGEKKESNSIANQRKLIEDYLSRNPEITLVQEFCDDGYTGANFDRPDFQRMMEQVKTGKINCIIVKDLSRFGRDYIDSGRYIEKIFPSLGIRFIAINDNYDSAQSQQAGNEIILPFKNLINDSYSRDISIKIRSNLETKRRNGEFVGSHVVYGYRRSDDDKNKLVIDQTVARELNAEGILTPQQYKGVARRKDSPSKALWTHNRILDMLKNVKYTGCMVNHTRESMVIRAKSQRRVPKEDWIYHENAHEAIVTTEEFEAAQAALRKVRPHTKKNKENSFPFYCAHCGRKLQRTFGTDVHFYCVTPYWDTDEEPCKSVRWDRTDIEEVVLAALKAQIAVMTVETVGKIQNTTSEGTLLRQRLKVLVSELESGDTQKVQSYLDYREGRITKEEFITLRSEREKRMEELKNLIAETEVAYEDFLEKENQAKQEQAIVERTSSMNDEALKELMYDAVERINVTDNQNIEIIWKFDDLFATA